MVHVICRRLKHELNDQYTVVNELEPGVPRTISYLYKGVELCVDLGTSYPFHYPDQIGDWTHERYSGLTPFVKAQIGDKCICCTICNEWSPCKKLVDIVEQFIEADTAISNAVKLEVVFRNVLHLPEDVFPIIFSYLRT
jgi:hypothetical protein